MSMLGPLSVTQNVLNPKTLFSITLTSSLEIKSSGPMISTRLSNSFCSLSASTCPNSDSVLSVIFLRLEYTFSIRSSSVMRPSSACFNCSRTSGDTSTLGPLLFSSFSFSFSSSSSSIPNIASNALNVFFIVVFSSGASTIPIFSKASKAEEVLLTLGSGTFFRTSSSLCISFSPCPGWDPSLARTTPLLSLDVRHAGDLCAPILLPARNVAWEFGLKWHEWGLETRMYELALAAHELTPDILTCV
mmetsp:Transcript_19750/g.27374  ORF Transcript_19750/g.27374 Transcript_19750/m.27374 type:complete len:246 (+) Transcript_19750:1524-2261(+)